MSKALEALFVANKTIDAKAYPFYANWPATIEMLLTRFNLSEIEAETLVRSNHLLHAAKWVGKEDHVRPEELEAYLRSLVSGDWVSWLCNKIA